MIGAGDLFDMVCDEAHNGSGDVCTDYDHTDSLSEWNHGSFGDFSDFSARESWLWQRGGSQKERARIRRRWEQYSNVRRRKRATELQRLKAGR